ncbi:MAG: DUF4115 domain-containing protein [Elusimicrobiota bacterium]|jgi:cytoskeletal protein RodZ|nr:DUF4115 domain-containing protein [Elusimicrobiota bacterium]
MREIGQILKAERENKSISYDQIYEAIKVQKKYLIAIEEGDESAFVAKVYYMSFMKAYAKYLNLNFDELYKDYELRKIKDEEMKKSVQNPQVLRKEFFLHRFVEFVKTKKVSILLITIAILCAIVIYLYVTSAKNQIIVQEEDIIEVYDNTQTSAKSQTPPSPLLPQPANIPQTQTIPESLELSTVSVLSPSSQIEPKTAAQQPALPAGIRTDIDIDAVAASRNSEKQILAITVNNADAVWISVEADGKKVSPIDGITLKRGERVVWEANNSFRVVIGYAPGVIVTFNGVVVDATVNSKQDVSVLNLRKP